MTGNQTCNQGTRLAAQPVAPVSALAPDPRLEWRGAGLDQIDGTCEICHRERRLTHWRPAGRFNQWACFDCATSQNKGLKRGR